MTTEHHKPIPIPAPRRSINSPSRPPADSLSSEDGGENDNTNCNGGNQDDRFVNANGSAGAGMPRDIQKPQRRSPVSLLKEVSEKLEGEAKIEYVRMTFTGLPVFACFANVKGDRFNFNGKGSGFTKSDAKQEASRDILLQMNPNWEPYLTPTVIPIPFDKLQEIVHEPPTPNSPQNDELDGLDMEDIENLELSATGNPISDLNLFCQKSGIPTPSYEDVGSRVGEGNTQVFFAECSLNADVKGMGHGTNKKNARRSASSAVIGILRNLGKSGRLATALSPRDGSTIASKIFKGKDELERCYKTYILGGVEEDFKRTQIQCTFPQSAAEFLKSFSTWNGTKTNALKIMPEKRLKMCSAFHLLKDISEEQDLQMELLDFEVEVEKPPFRCLAFSTNYPLLNRLGRGEDKAKAREAAAFEVLDFIRNMIRA